MPLMKLKGFFREHEVPPLEPQQEKELDRIMAAAEKEMVKKSKHSKQVRHLSRAYMSDMSTLFTYTQRRTTCSNKHMQFQKN